MKNYFGLLPYRYSRNMNYMKIIWAIIWQLYVKDTNYHEFVTNFQE